ncbi:uncharacterized protein [Asterias amurensis]|uniref:uncharacterized protein n=1 Tax=Asterias amurensis TaxID=7602 RepID=UPI003AB5D86A
MGDYVNCDSSEETTFKDSTLTDVGVELGTDSDTTRRVRGVRFLAELTISINHTSDSSPTVHSTCEKPTRRAPPVVGPAGSSFYGKEQRTCDRDQDMSREPVQFQRWRTDRREREAKMEQNIKWLKEEIGKLKEQDQSLMRQFLQLRSVIYQLKSTMKAANKGAVTKLPRIAASTDSLVRASHSDTEVLVARLAVDAEEESFDDDDLNEMDDSMGLMEESYLPEFRNRTVSLMDPSKMGRGRGRGAAECGGYGYLKTRTMSFSVGASARELDRAIIE